MRNRGAALILQRPHERRAYKSDGSTSPFSGNARRFASTVKYVRLSTVLAWERPVTRHKHREMLSLEFLDVRCTALMRRPTVGYQLAPSTSTSIVDVRQCWLREEPKPSGRRSHARPRANGILRSLALLLPIACAVNVHARLGTKGPYRLVVRTSRRGRDNPGSTPGEDIFLRGVVSSIAVFRVLPEGKHVLILLSRKRKRSSAALGSLAPQLPAAAQLLRKTSRQWGPTSRQS